MVFIVDDEAPIRDALQWLLKSRGVKSRTFASAAEFQAYRAETAEGGVKPGCVILDIRMPGISGVEVHEQLVRRGTLTPVIFVTGHGDVPMAVEAIKRGAFDFIEKPFSETKLMAIIERALEEDARKAGASSTQSGIAQRLAKLSPREKEVLDLVIAGKMNKTIADAMNISIKTVEAHRAKVMDKMGARSLAELVQLVMQAKA